MLQSLSHSKLILFLGTFGCRVCLTICAATHVNQILTRPHTCSKLSITHTHILCHQIFDALQVKHTNKHLLYVLLETLLVAVDPELSHRDLTTAAVRKWMLNSPSNFGCMQLFVKRILIYFRLYGLFKFLNSFSSQLLCSIPNFSLKSLLIGYPSLTSAKETNVRTRHAEPSHSPHTDSRES